MALMHGCLYRALLAADVPPERARRAAEDAAAYENPFPRIKADLAVLKWMAGFNTALMVAVLTLLLRGMMS